MSLETLFCFFKIRKKAALKLVRGQKKASPHLDWPQARLRFAF
jgi:hypothetical protein